MVHREPIVTALRRPLRAAAVITGHLILGAVVTMGIWATERLFNWLWAEQTPRFFDWIPVKWLFDASEFGVMIVFVVFGILEAYQKMKR